MVKFKRNCFVAFVLFSVSLLFQSCGFFESYYTREYEYYSDKNNYIVGEAVVENIIYDDDALFLWLLEIDERYQDTTFVIRGDNVNTVIENGFFDKVENGCTITFSSAPRYFGDGYIMPIVSLSIDGLELLDFDTGYKNLVSDYEDNWQHYVYRLNHLKD